MGPESISYIEIVSELGATGMLGWVLYQVFRKTVPDLKNDFKEALESQQKLFQDILAQQQELSERQREEFISALTKLEVNMEKMAERIERLTIVVAKQSDDDVI